MNLLLSIVVLLNIFSFLVLLNWEWKILCSLYSVHKHSTQYSYRHCLFAIAKTTPKVNFIHFLRTRFEFASYKWKERKKCRREQQNAVTKQYANKFGSSAFPFSRYDNQTTNKREPTAQNKHTTIFSEMFSVFFVFEQQKKWYWNLWKCICKKSSSKRKSWKSFSRQKVKEGEEKRTARINGERRTVSKQCAPQTHT